MTCWVVIPIKPLDECKTRLRGALTDDARRDLVRSMLTNVIQAARTAKAAGHVALLGPRPDQIPEDVISISDEASELNAALTHAAHALPADAARLIILPADLPRVTAADIDRLAATPNAAIAPDHAGLGTNALSLPLPAARAFRFAFGEGSFARHQAEAARLDLPLQIVRTDTLGLDIDTPADLELLRSGV